MITWLASYPKSGNTWVRLLLNAYLNERNDINYIPVAVGDTQKYYYNALSPKPDYTMQESILLRPAVLMHMVANGADVVKTHNANTALSGVHLIPSALTDRAIHILRDPRDVVISLASHFGQSIDEAIEALNDESRGLDNDHSFHYLGTWSYHAMSWENANYPVLKIRYEDLLSNPHHEMKRLLPFINIEPDEDRINMAVDLTRFDKLQDQERESGFKEKSEYQDLFFAKGKSTWQTTLTKDQIERIESVHSDVMRRNGYALYCQKVA